MATFIVDDYIKKLSFLEIERDKKKQSFIHFRSMKNFLKYYDELENIHKPAVSQLIEGYFDSLSKEVNNRQDSKGLYENYIQRIGIIYNVALKFKVYKVFTDALVWGTLLDIILYFIGVSQNFLYIPVGIIIFVSNWFYVYYRFERRNKVFGPLY